jgi:hypothetical protein
MEKPAIHFRTIDPDEFAAMPNQIHSIILPPVFGGLGCGF